MYQNYIALFAYQGGIALQILTELTLRELPDRGAYHPGINEHRGSARFTSRR